MANSIEVELLALPILQTHGWPGRLIALDGIKRAGKSSVIEALQEELIRSGHEVVMTAWNSVPELNALITKKKIAWCRDALTWTALHYADFVVRYVDEIVPALQRGAIVLADRYIYTALARDVVRGVSEDYVATCYGFAAMPDVSFYFHVPPEVSLERQLKSIGVLNLYPSGRDIWPELPPEESYKRYQYELGVRYMQMVPFYRIHVIDGTRPLDQSVSEVISTVFQHLDSADTRL